MNEKTKKVLKRLGAAVGMLLITFVLLLVYELSVRYVWRAVFWTYFAVLAAAMLGVAIYNRGFSRSFYRREELPHAWSEAQKDAFFAEARTWWRQSKPIILFVILPILLCIGFDILCLFLWGPLVELFPVLG